MGWERKSDVLFGVNSVSEKLRASPGEVVDVLIATGKAGSFLRAVEAEARRRGITVHFVDAKRLDRLAEGGRHQGIVALVEPYPYGDLSTLLGELPASPAHHWILLLDGLNDPRNFGALLRTAEAVGIREIVIPANRAVGVTPTVAKASAGAMHYLRICRLPNLRRAIGALKEKGYWVVGLDASAKDGAFTRAYPEKLVVVLGSEGSGVRPLLRRECDYLVSLPMRGRVKSLNVAVAGGIFLYELLRQKEAGGAVGRAGGQIRAEGERNG